MDIFFTNPDDVPLPPDKMEIRELSAVPFEDGKRVSVEFEITPFQQRPNLEITVFNQESRIVSSLSVVEAIENKMTFTLHLKEPKPTGHYQVAMELFYAELDKIDEDEDSLIKDIVLQSKKIIATTETSFEIPHND